MESIYSLGRSFPEYDDLHRDIFNLTEMSIMGGGRNPFIETVSYLPFELPAEHSNLTSKQFITFEDFESFEAEVTYPGNELRAGIGSNFNIASSEAQISVEEYEVATSFDVSAGEKEIVKEVPAAQEAQKNVDEREDVADDEVPALQEVPFSKVLVLRYPLREIDIEPGSAILALPAQIDVGIAKKRSNSVRKKGKGIKGKAIDAAVQKGKAVDAAMQKGKGVDAVMQKGKAVDAAVQKGKGVDAAVQKGKAVGVGVHNKEGWKIDDHIKANNSIAVASTSASLDTPPKPMNVEPTLPSPADKPKEKKKRRGVIGKFIQLRDADGTCLTGKVTGWKRVYEICCDDGKIRYSKKEDMKKMMAHKKVNRNCKQRKCPEGTIASDCRAHET